VKLETQAYHAQNSGIFEFLPPLVTNLFQVVRQEHNILPFRVIAAVNCILE
jgi:hypothetical protein